MCFFLDFADFLPGSGEVRKKLTHWIHRAEYMMQAFDEDEHVQQTLFGANDSDNENIEMMKMTREKSRSKRIEIPNESDDGEFVDYQAAFDE